jgi:adenylyl-sulfate kinase
MSSPILQTTLPTRPLVRCIWFTGLSGAGKSTIAELVHQRLVSDGRAAFQLDGDLMRNGLCRDLGFTERDRIENVRRLAEVAKLMSDAGLTVLVSAISPYRTGRAFARSLFAEGAFIEVFVDAPLAICEQRDSKGLYAKARRNEIKHFTGIDSEYQRPQAAEVHLLTAVTPPETCADVVCREIA